MLLGLAIACGVTFLGYTVCLLGVAGRALMNEADGLMVAWLLFAMLFVLAAFAIVVTYAVFAFISLYYVYKSCNPDTAVVFLDLSIVIPATMPFFLLADRNLDRGMPPGGRSPSLCRRLRRMWSQPGKNLRKPRRRSLRAHLKNCKRIPGISPASVGDIPGIVQATFSNSGFSTRLYSSRVNRETTAAFNRLRGATEKSTSVDTE